MTKDNAYKLLGLPTTCENEEEIKKAFKKLAMKHHPDKGGSEENFKKLLTAKEVLLNPKASTVNFAGREFTQEQYDAMMKEVVRKMREDMERMENIVLGTPRQRRIRKIRGIVCVVYLAKVLLFTLFGISTPLISIISLMAFFLFFGCAPLIADLIPERSKK